MTTPASSSPLQALPDDVMRRLLAGVPRLDHDAMAAACQAFRAVIKGSNFLALRRRYGFAEREIVLVGTRYAQPNNRVITACTDEIQVSFASGFLRPGSVSTTDGGARIFVCTMNDDLRLNDPNLVGEAVWEVDVNSRECRRFATLPLRRSYHCMEWHRGLLYVAGGYGRREEDWEAHHLSSLDIFNETTGVWEASPAPMPLPCTCAASGVISNQLFVVGGLTVHPAHLELQPTHHRALRIYDFTTRTWRLGAPLPRTMPNLECGVVADGKLFAIRNDDRVMFVYEPKTDTWTEEAFPWWDSHVGRACSHNGRVVVFLKDGTSFERLARDEWQPYDVVGEVGDIAHDANTYPNTYVAESVLLG